MAHAGGLRRAKILTVAEYQKIAAGLRAIEREIGQGRFKFDPELEDIHMNIEAALTRKIGAVAGKLHTGRSRNDQVATDLRLYLKDKIKLLNGLLQKFCLVLLRTAERQKKVILPGHTHLQIAQPVLLAHHLLAYVEMFIRDRQRLVNIFSRVDVLPLGAAALAGTAYPLDRQAIARELGFAVISQNSIDAVADRDFLVEFQAAAALIMVHLSRMSEELILWNTAQFGYIELSDAYTTGSSIMPQKKNPDIPELVRGKTGRVLGNLQNMLTVLKGLPLAYNRDLQEDKQPLFDTVQTLTDCLRIMTELWRTSKFRADKMRADAERGFATATDLADYLVRRGVPFRQAHELTGRIVAHCLKQDKALSDLTLADFRRFSAKIGADIYQSISLAGSLAARNVYGGTAPAQVAAACQRVRKRIKLYE
ncbi:adenylosuccinate lyase [Candidatus Termititenax persephonae]|uniref:Argininosuccinate lyase n=1 Tax=Candidatus Termititenax persephonae TaxID=2218525 RepID=A0A388THR8_9BACT|nr:adenylosuccinate lyase [Candidatus Termititenax persephonae]